MAKPTVPKKTKCDVIVGSIREDIASGHFEPGARLDEMTLAHRYGVSRTPVREALAQLVATSDVTRQAHRGCRVASKEAAQ